MLTVAALTATVLVVIVVVGLTTGEEQTEAPSAGAADLSEVTEHEVEAEHVIEPVDYEQIPPVGGAHKPLWLNCGVYDEPIPSENAVHSMEHDAAWITYDPSLSDEDVALLEERTPATYAILSPFEGLPSPVAVSAHARFAREVQVHHAQAVEMSFLILDRTEDRWVESMAQDIAAAQQHQIRRCTPGWSSWGVPQTGSAPAMDWMNTSGLDDPHHLPEEGTAASVPMPGIATQAELDRLRGTSRRAAERLWLRLMIRHRLGGSTWPQAALDMAAEPEVKQLAEAIVSPQQNEVVQMRKVLAGRRDGTP